LLKNKCTFAKNLKVFKLSNKNKSVVALGTFDGVHLGHQKIIKELLKEAKASDCKPIVVTFFPHPTHILTPDKPLKMINSLDERLALLKKNGIDTIIVKEFTKEFSEQSALDFVRDELMQKLNMQTLIVGFDHGFGKNKEGNYEALKQYSKELGFTIKKVAAYELEGVAVSSTLIRNLLIEGQIIKTNKYLDYSFCLFGEVEKGNQLGRKIGFRTANIVLDYPNKIVPKYGVYIVQSLIDGTMYFGMMNIGNRPTIDGQTRTIEVHYLDIEKNLYNKKIKVTILYRLRDEFKFNSIEELKEQLIKDKENTKSFIAALG